MSRGASKQKAANDAAEITSSVELAREQVSHELVFGIVGHVGSGTSTVAETLKGVFGALKREETTYQCEVVKARSVIESWARAEGLDVPAAKPLRISDVEKFQDLGDEMRRRHQDHAAVARGAITEIRRIRARLQGTKITPDEPIVPDGQPRALIVDSIRHPAEVQLLRHLYGDGFVLVGVVCEEAVRKERLSKKYRDAGLDAAEAFMRRDAKAAEKHGQRVSDAFHLSDYFLDNTAPRYLDNKGLKANPKWEIADDLTRLIKLVTHDEIERPTVDETAMFAAAGAGMRSACLSRQVGAALLDIRGNIVATGSNEVPKAGGGVYGERFEGNEEADERDHRCFKSNKYCSNTREQTLIAEQILEDLSESLAHGVNKGELIQRLKHGRVGELLEFSRAVHAEMDALLAAGRKGTSTVGCRLYVTTFPCHYCARHVVSAGVDEVQFIEPYPKSKAFSLHSDSILNDNANGNWTAPSVGGKQVLFRPFTGVAPRMYRRAFQKDRELKDKESGQMTILSPEWGSPYDIGKTSYAQFEVELTKGFGA